MVQRLLGKTYTERLEILRKDLKSLMTVTSRQSRNPTHLAIAMSSYGITNRKARLLLISELLQREIWTTKDLSDVELESLYTLWDGETREAVLLHYFESKEKWIQEGKIKVRKPKDAKIDTKTTEREGNSSEEGSVSMCGDGLGFSLGDMEEYFYTGD